MLYCGMISWEPHKFGDIVEWLTVQWHMLYCFGWRRDILWENENVVISEWMKSKAQYFGWQVLSYATCQFSSFAVEYLRINCNKYWRKLFLFADIKWRAWHNVRILKLMATWKCIFEHLSQKLLNKWIYSRINNILGVKHSIIGWIVLTCHLFNA